MDALLISFSPGGQLIHSLENIDAGRRLKKHHYFEAEDEKGTGPWRDREADEEKTITLL